MEKQFGKVGEVDLFSHSGNLDGPNFNYGHNRAGGPHYTNEQVPGGLLGLKINWNTSSSRAGFYGCNSADFAQRFANSQGVSTYGFDESVHFSGSPERRTLAPR